MEQPTFRYSGPGPCDSHVSQEKGSKYLESESDVDDEPKDQYLSLNNPPSSRFRRAALKDTIYRDKPDEVNGWGKFYLPQIVNMQVVGVVEGTSCPSDGLVLMTCEDERLYAYDGEELHVVGRSLDQLKKGEIQYPSVETYYNGQAFEHMTEEDWEEVKRGPVGQELEEEHRKLVEENKSAFLENLKIQK